MGGAELGGRPRSERWAGVKAMSARSSFERSRGRQARPMFTIGTVWTTRMLQRMYSFVSADLKMRVSFKMLCTTVDRAYSGVGSYSAPAKRSNWMMIRAARLYTIVLTLSLLKVVACWRRVISLIRGCCQFPGESTTGDGVALDGVVRAP